MLKEFFFTMPITLLLLLWLKSIWALLWPQEETQRPYQKLKWKPRSSENLRCCFQRVPPAAKEQRILQGVLTTQESRCDRPMWRSSWEMCLLSIASSADKFCFNLFGLFCLHSPERYFVCLMSINKVRHKKPTSKTNMRNCTRQRGGFIF